MSAANNKASEAEFERRSSQRGSIRMSMVGVEGHRDSTVSLAEAAAFDALIADGPRRPSAGRRRSSSAATGRLSSSLGRQNSTPMVVDPSLMPPPLAPQFSKTPDNSSTSTSTSSPSPASGIRSSIAKPPISQPQQPKGDYLALQTPGSSASRPQMPTLATNNFTLASDRASLPSSGPSHPYGMYEQGINAGAMSQAPSQPPMPQVAQGPSHPYGMYSQNIDPMATNAIPMAPMQPVVPVAPIMPGPFGPNGGYQRRIGPDGEESGLVGPFGHTEELPPYTRYPEQGHNTSAKAEEASNNTSAGVAAMPAVAGSNSLSPVSPVDAQANSPVSFSQTHSHSASVAGASIVSQEQRRSQVLESHNIAGAGGIGLATRDPEFAASNDMGRNVAARQSYMSEQSAHDINIAAQGISEKTAPKKPWQVWARKKVAGVVPMWAIVMLGVILLLMGIILGTVIGTIVSKQKKHRPPPGLQNPWTNSVVPLKSVPASLEKVTTGSYNIPPLMADAAPTQCLNDTTYSQSWSCTMPVHWNFDIERADTEGVSEYVLSLSQGNSSNLGKYIWGNQPIKPINQARLSPANDTENMNWGPAWWVNLTYDKVVLIAEDRFPAYTGPQKLRRDEITLDAGLDEEFTETPTTTSSSASYNIATLTTTVTSVATETFRPHMKGSFERKSPQEGDIAWMCTWPGTRLDIMVFPNQNNSVISGASGIWPSYTQTLPSPTGDTSTVVSDPMPTGSGFGSPGNVYPEVVTIHEQRIQSKQNVATCVKMQILNNGTNAMPIVDDDNELISVHLVEKTGDGVSRRDVVYESEILARDKNDIGCACAWSLT